MLCNILAGAAKQGQAWKCFPGVGPLFPIWIPGLRGNIEPPDDKDGQPQRGVDMEYEADGFLQGWLNPLRGAGRIGWNFLQGS